MTNTKAFKPNDPYTRITELERRMKTLEAISRDIAVPIPMAFSGTFAGITYSADGLGIVTSGAMIGVWVARMIQTISDALYVAVPVSSDVGTTGEVQLTDPSGPTFSGVFTVPSGANSLVIFRWLHGHALKVTDPIHSGVGTFTPTIQARRTSGAGNVYVATPTEVVIIRGQYIGATASDAGVVLGP